MTTDKVVWCDTGQYPGVFHYGFCPSEKAWYKEMKRLGENEPYPTSDGRTTYFPTTDEHNTCCIVTIKEGLENTGSIAALTGLMLHETIHVWQFLCQKIGEDDPGDEMEAYAVQFMYLHLIDAFEKTRKELKNYGR